MTVLGVNGLFVRPGLVGGAEFMLYNLLRGFTSVLSEHDTLTVFTNGALDFAALSDRCQCIDLESRCVGNRFLRETLTLAHASRGFNAMLHPNYFTPPIRTAKRNVAVIHDLQYLHYPAHFAWKKRCWLRAAHFATLSWADAVVAISGFVRDDLIHHFGDRFASRIEVIPNPISWDRFGPPSSIEPQEPYVLAVTAQYPHKNLHTLIEAFAKVRSRRPELSLILAGQVPSNLVGVTNSIDLRQLVVALKLEDTVRITGYVSDEELGRLYRGASLFVFPSLFEGFGMPVIEALGFGLPVLTTRCGSLPEVTRGLGHFVDDPLDSTELANRIVDMTTDPAAYVPTVYQVDGLRTFYAPQNIATQYYELMTRDL